MNNKAFCKQTLDKYLCLHTISFSSTPPKCSA